MRSWLPGIVAIGLLAMVAGPTRAGRPKPPITDAEIAQATAAAPAKPSTQPSAPRRVLICNASATTHDSAVLAAKAIEILGSKSKAYSAQTTSDPTSFEADNLNCFDAVVMNNTTGDPFASATEGDPAAARKRSQRLRQNLLDFVNSGKGLVGLHAAADCLSDWTEYAPMIGAAYAGRPFTRAVVKIDDPGHPVNAAFGGEGFEVNDEIYSFRWPYSRQSVRVLLSVDWAKSKLYGGDRPDRDYALSWVKPQGKGRVFYCALGHDRKTFLQPKILRHLLDGIQFALGDLPGPIKPSDAPPK